MISILKKIGGIIIKIFFWGFIGNPRLGERLAIKTNKFIDKQEKKLKAKKD